ncbi:hypothetical protein [Clostridium sp.]|uniref:hypothetical protein n=1 Tax=Clostridium sp. TaxID=1506 RepID=UPI0026136873|nr:hypothetical protein [Clostridium sp.]
MNVNNHDLLQLSIKALWNCKQPFTKEELTNELCKLNIELLDWNTFLIIFKNVLVEIDGKYKIDISKIFKDIIE